MINVKTKICTTTPSTPATVVNSNIVFIVY